MSIEAKVAAVLSTREVALSAGEDAGVKEGDIATLYKTIDVTHPDTGELLGSVRRSRVRFVVTEVEPRMSIGRALGSVERPDTLLTFGSASRDKEPVLVTANPANANYRTFFLEIGEPVEITPSEKSDAPF